MTAISVPGSGALTRTFRPVHAPLRPGEFTPGQRVYLAVRRGADVVVAGLALVVLSPLLLAVTVAVLVTMGRPVMFVQERTTMHSRIFWLRKFRTMHQVDSNRGLVTDADRITRLGSWLRSTSIDELPSLWNVLAGHLTLIGPRPLTPDYLPRYSAEQLARHEVPGGITGLAQVSGRNTVAWDDRFALDCEYVRRVGPLLDLQILARTVAAVLRRDGISAEGQVTVASFPGPMRTGRLTVAPGPHPGEWVCSTVHAEPVARATLTAGEEETVLVGLHPVSAGEGDPAGREELLIETLTLLLSRAREHGYRYAATQLAESDALLAAVFARHGFERSDVLPEDTLLVAFIGDA